MYTRTRQEKLLTSFIIAGIPVLLTFRDIYTQSSSSSWIVVVNNRKVGEPSRVQSSKYWSLMTLLKITNSETSRRGKKSNQILKWIHQDTQNGWGRREKFPHYNVIHSLLLKYVSLIQYFMEFLFHWVIKTIKIISHNLNFSHTILNYYSFSPTPCFPRYCSAFACSLAWFLLRNYGSQAAGTTQKKEESKHNHKILWFLWSSRKESVFFFFNECETSLVASILMILWSIHAIVMNKYVFSSSFSFISFLFSPHETIANYGDFYQVRYLRVQRIFMFMPFLCSIFH